MPKMQCYPGVPHLLTKPRRKAHMIDHLPVEILLNIFERLLETPQLKSPVLLDACTLSLVRRSWRDIVDSYPHLWTNISISHRRHIDTSPLQARLSYIIDRSKDRPLSIVLMNPSPLLGRLLACAHRWKRAELTITAIDASNLQMYRFPLLEKCTINLDGQDTIGSCMINGPALQHVAVQVPSPFNPFVFPWAQLTHLELELAFVDPLARIIPPISPPAIDINPDRYPLPNLTYLHTNNYPQALDGLLAPQLRHIVLTTDRMIDTLVDCEWIYNRIISLIIDSECDIETVEFRVPTSGVKLANESVNRLLEFTPNLRDLRFSVFDMVPLLSLDWWSIGNLPALENVEDLTIRVSKSVAQDPLVRSLTPQIPFDVLDEKDLEVALGSPRSQWEAFVSQSDVLLHIIQTKLIPLNFKRLNLEWDSSAYRDWYHNPRISRRLREIESWGTMVDIPGVDFSERVDVSVVSLLNTMEPTNSTP
ncbi:hypothetical protein AAF712_014846 [Marasmius tenuissimus]|uniref:F-box domain-containing protein n=1 Tax=Marasmius tenuissimus TaxID=585030 RepID=A0ABR2ZB27_9AGAR